MQQQRILSVERYVPVLVIGDCHGHLDRLKALLEQEGCAERSQAYKTVQVGDLGHFGNSQAKDAAIYDYAREHIDIVLWGNHDRAALWPGHAFNGYEPPFAETKDAMKQLMHQGRYRLAYAAHDFLLTHAGLHAAFRHQHVDPAIKNYVHNFVAWVRRCDEEQDPPESFKGVRDAISVTRGGYSRAGGILWRDASEKLYDSFRQVFGHSSKNDVRKYHAMDGWSYCVDIGTPTNGRLAGIWLPEERVVEVRGVGL